MKNENKLEGIKGVEVKTIHDNELQSRAEVGDIHMVPSRSYIHHPVVIELNNKIKTKLPVGHTLDERIAELKEMLRTTDDERLHNFIPSSIEALEFLGTEEYMYRQEFLAKLDESHEQLKEAERKKSMEAVNKIMGLLGLDSSFKDGGYCHGKIRDYRDRGMILASKLPSNHTRLERIAELDAIRKTDIPPEAMELADRICEFLNGISDEEYTDVTNHVKKMKESFSKHLGRLDPLPLNVTLDSIPKTQDESESKPIKLYGRTYMESVNELTNEITTKLHEGHTLKERIGELKALVKTTGNEKAKEFIPILISHYESLSEECYQERMSFIRALKNSN